MRSRLSPCISAAVLVSMLAVCAGCNSISAQQEQERAGSPQAAAKEDKGRLDVKRQADTRLRIVVMDPLAEPLSCACVEGVGQRKYDVLAKFLEKQLEISVDLVFDESLNLAYDRSGRDVDLIIGKASVVEYDAEQTGTRLRRLLHLTDRQGRTGITGTFLVRKVDKAKSLTDLQGRKIALAPHEDEESHAAARRRLEDLRIAERCEWTTAGSMDAAVYAVTDGEADAAIVSDFLPPLLEGCGKVAPGALRAVGSTGEVPFVALFATDRLDAKRERRLKMALALVAQDEELLEALESKQGFVRSHKASQTAQQAARAWTDWRGPGRRGASQHVPNRLPKNPRVFWRAQVTGPAMAGIAATEKLVVVADKDAELTTDIIRCFEAETGRPRWQHRYQAGGDVDYTNAPRATPVIHDGKVYTQGALGHLHCLDLATGNVIWKKNIVTDFGGELLTWGCSIPPLVVDDKLVIAPGAKDASLAALALDTGKVLWKTPGHAGAYAPFVVGTFGETRQVVGYDVGGLGGWDPKTGRRLWELVPPGQVDFHVGTPLVSGGDLIVATENNATRRYGFNPDGTPRQKPAESNEDLAPDTCSPVLVGHRLFCSAYGELFCLDASDGLKTVWIQGDDMFFDHTNLIAGKNRVLIWTTTGDLLLIRADIDRYELVSHIRPFAGEDVETWSHPAIVGDRLYVRCKDELVCLSLTEDIKPAE